MLIVPLFTATASPAFGQGPTVELVDIHERRDTQRSGMITVTLKINNLKIEDEHLIKIENIQLINNTGGNEELSGSTEYKDETKGQVTIDFPGTLPRSISQLDEIKGSIKCFLPTGPSKSKIRIPVKDLKFEENILEGFNKEVGLVPYDAKRLEDLEKKDRDAFRKEVERIYAIAEAIDPDQLFIIIDGRSTGNIPDEAFHHYVSPKGLSFLHYDPEKRLIDVRLFGADGRRNYASVTHTHRQYFKNFMRAIDPEGYIEIIVETGPAVTVVPFEFKGVRMP